MKKIFNKFVSVFTNVYKWIFKPVQVSVEVEEPKEPTKDDLYKLEFKAKYGLDSEHINEIIGKINDTHPLHPENQNDRARLNEFLIEGSKYINEHKTYISPFFYEPEIINIHNESLVDRVGPTMRQIVLEDDKKVSETLTYQKRILDNGVQVYPPSIASKITYKSYKRKEKVIQTKVDENKTLESLIEKLRETHQSLSE